MTKRHYYGALLRQSLRYSLVVRLVRLVPLLGFSLYSARTNAVLENIIRSVAPRSSRSIRTRAFWGDVR